MDQRLRDLMLTRVVTVAHTATILDASMRPVLRQFVQIRAISVSCDFRFVDEQRRILGVVDVGLFTQEVLDLGERFFTPRSEKSTRSALRQVLECGSPLPLSHSCALL